MKTLTKHISCECKCKLDGTNCNSNQWWNNNKCRRKCKEHHICEKEYAHNPSICENISDIMDKIICDEIIDVKETNFYEKNITCKTQSFYILRTFLLITIILLIAVSI